MKEVTLGRLEDAYGRVCRQWQVKSEGVAEFVGLCQVLESRGILAIKKAKETRMTKVHIWLHLGSYTLHEMPAYSVCSIAHKINRGSC